MPMKFANIKCLHGSRHIFRVVLTHPADLHWEPAVCQAGSRIHSLTHESCGSSVILYVTRVWRGCWILSCFCLSIMGSWARHRLSFGHAVRTKKCKTKLMLNLCISTKQKKSMNKADHNIQDRTVHSWLLLS